MPNEQITEDGEIISERSLSLIDVSAMVGLAEAEINSQVATARRFPRSVDRAIKNIISLATLDEETAEECCYALVRSSKRRGRNDDNGQDNKAIEGPSIRLAEIAAQAWGNCRIDARVVAVNRAEKYVEAEGTFLDLETNMASRATVRRRISTRDGRVFSDDMIVVTGNAACSIAKRNAILAGIPRGVYRPAYKKAREIIAGTVLTLAENRRKAIEAFASFGVTPAQIFDLLGVAGEGDLKLDHIATLRALFSSIKHGETTVEETFAPQESATHKVVSNPLSDKEPETREPSGADSAQASEVGSESDRGKAPPTLAADGSEPPNDDFPGDRPPLEDAVALAFRAGQEAKARGANKRALPAEYREDGRDAEKTAWLAGLEGEAA